MAATPLPPPSADPSPSPSDQVAAKKTSATSTPAQRRRMQAAQKSRRRTKIAAVVTVALFAGAGVLQVTSQWEGPPPPPRAAGQPLVSLPTAACPTPEVAPTQTADVNGAQWAVTIPGNSAAVFSTPLGIQLSSDAKTLGVTTQDRTGVETSVVTAQSVDLATGASEAFSLNNVEVVGNDGNAFWVKTISTTEKQNIALLSPSGDVLACWRAGGGSQETGGYEWGIGRDAFTVDGQLLGLSDDPVRDNKTATWEPNKLTLHRLSRDGQANAVVLRNERLPSDITMARLVAVDQRSVWVHESTGTASARASGTYERVHALSRYNSSTGALLWTTPTPNLPSVINERFTVDAAGELTVVSQPLAPYGANDDAPAFSAITAVRYDSNGTPTPLGEIVGSLLLGGTGTGVVQSGPQIYVATIDMVIGRESAQPSLWVFGAGDVAAVQGSAAAAVRWLTAVDGGVLAAELPGEGTTLVVQDTGIVARIDTLVVARTPQWDIAVAEPPGMGTKPMVLVGYRR